jgi:hypothetical protein
MSHRLKPFGGIDQQSAAPAGAVPPSMWAIHARLRHDIVG